LKGCTKTAPWDSLGFGVFHCGVEGLAEVLAGEDHFCSVSLSRLDLRQRGRAGHEDGGRNARESGRERHALAVIAGRRGNNPDIAHALVEPGDPVVRAPDLE
jgi:hypothetical protein